MKQLLASLCTLILAMASVSSQADETVTRGSRLSVDVATDGRIAMNLAGDIWTVPLAGGNATNITQGLESAHRPRWSADDSRIAYTTVTAGRQGIRIYDTHTRQSLDISDGAYVDMHPAWHPHGERLAYASDRAATGFDLWEADLPSGLHWRLSSRPGDETEPVWSADGRHLVYVHSEDGRWSLILRRHGEPEEILVVGDERITGPSWRPDGSLITFWRAGDSGLALDMVILSQPRLIRRYMAGEDFMSDPISWLDKHRMFYSAGGVIRQRLFNSWSSRTVPFRATIQTAPEVVVEKVRRALPRINEPQGRLVIHASRLFDGVGGGYQRDHDILIEGGRITAVEPHANRPDTIVIDMGDLTVLPGYVDAQARLPADTTPRTGPLLLAAGVTTIVADHPEAEHLNTIWSGKEMPGPRLLPATDWVIEAYSGLADSMTPHLDALLQSRPALLLNYSEPVARRFSESRSIDARKTSVVLGSHPNGMPAGIALHAELRALVAAQLSPVQALRAAGVNAAAALYVDPGLGRLATGAVADMVFVDGDPLTDITASLNVVAVVRNGRFFSVAGLIDRSEAAKTVETVE